MFNLTDIQREKILKYVDDKTYFNRKCFLIGIILFIVGMIMLPNYSIDNDGFATAISSLMIGLSTVAITFKDFLKFRNVKNQITDIGTIAIEKSVCNKCVFETSQNTNYDNQDTFYYQNLYASSPPRNSKIIIHKYFLLDKYNNQYECINYLDYKKCIEKGNFIAVDFPTGEKFALYYEC